MPAPIAPCHFPDLDLVEPYVRDGAIWLYRDRLAGHKLFGMLIYVAINHGSDRIVRLRVEYDDWQAASWLVLRDLKDPDIVKMALTHTLDAGAGQYGHHAEPIELVVSPVPPEWIKPDGEWNLLSLVNEPANVPLSPLPAASKVS